MENEACGFCLYNNVAIGAMHALNRLDYNRILIVDWDVHHGQATQYMFYDDPRVLYISIHRYDEQKFWPNLRESNFDFIGSGRGRGYNVNIPLNTKDVGDSDYLAIFHQLILPIAYEGELQISPALFAHLTHMLMCLAEGKLVIALEGGYYKDSLAESVAHTVSALLGDPMPSLDPLTEVHPSVRKSIADCVSVLRYRWRSLHLFQLAELIPAPELKYIPERSWEDVKVPLLEPENHTHTPEVEQQIADKLGQLKRTHPVSRNAVIPRSVNVLTVVCVCILDWFTSIGWTTVRFP
ncbi:unnamed protein product [Echinostoma caproni]|uniref:Hist_deacetyl domain-containing protein n=1 Tax=Echinostoma caproni TaxID=27848 RepID=A0A183AXI8_9TREM|nr:unnamed protein product [Echinostoma caproni]